LQDLSIKSDLPSWPDLANPYCLATLARGIAKPIEDAGLCRRISAIAFVDY
jgi:hypothetical protein